MTKQTSKKRIPIPAETKRKLLLECGFKCSMPLCENTHGLEFHHINGNPGDNREQNLLVLCAVHHSMVGIQGSKLDRKACRLLKDTLQTLAIPLAVDKDVLQAQWDEATDPNASLVAQASALEFFVIALLESIQGFIVVKSRTRNRYGDIDIVLRNESSEPFLNRLAGHILVECKVGPTSVGAREVQALLGKLALQHVRTGFLFSTSGFTNQAVAATGDGNRSDFTVVLFGPDEISDLVQADDRVRVLKDAVTQSVLA